MAVATSEVKVRPKARKRDRPPGSAKRSVAIGFLLPAVVFLGALVVYPLVDTIAQSFQDPATRTFVGLDNYEAALGRDTVVTALRNTLVWVAVLPAVITGGGLVYAVLAERIRYGTAIKIVLFMPAAIAFLSIGVIWRVMYETDPERGLVNATIGLVADTVSGPGPYPDATPAPEQDLEQTGGAIVSNQELEPGDTVTFGLVSILPEEVPEAAEQAVAPEASGDGITAVVWNDFRPGGGQPGEIEQEELGLSDATVELVDSSGEVVATETTDATGTAQFTDVGEGPFTARVGEATFAEGFTGFAWLAPALVTPAVMGAFFWAQVGFAVVVLAAGLSALPRDLLEAARVDGANEWQVFRRITIPLMAPVLTVVFITLLINTLKLFDIVYVLPPPSSQNAANVIALEMFRSSFLARRFGEGAVVAVILFIMVIPIMILNLRRFRRGES